jgi:hypothetical protein
MKAIAATLLGLVLVVSLAATAAQAKNPKGDATVVDNGYTLDPGVETSATYDSPVDQHSTSPVSNRNVSTDGSVESNFVPNRCVGITTGGFDFDLFANASCGSFSAPPSFPSRTFDPAAPPTPEQLAAIASDRAIALAPRPQLALSPRSVGLTGLRSFFWLGNDLPVVSAQATIPGLVVTAEARPVQYLWKFGDGGEITTRRAGRRWTRHRPGNIAHLYETKGRYDVTLEVIWQARWRANGSAWQPLGYFSNSDSDSYPVREMRAMLVRGR